MPLLSDAKTCYVGQTQIKQIYAGTQKVWPKVPNGPDCYPPASTIGFYHFQDNLENSEGSAPDLQNTSLAPTKQHEFVDGIFGKCVKRGYSYNTNSDLQLVSTITPINSDFTVEAWFKLDDVILKPFESVEMELSSGEFQESDANKLLMQIYNGTGSPMEGRFLFRFGSRPTQTGGTATIVASFGEVGITAANQWFHVALYCKADGTGGKAWINGKFKTANSNTPFKPGKPLTKLGIRIVDADNESHVCADEFRLVEGSIYPDTDINPC